MSDFYLDEEISDYWRLPNELTVRQAALLIVGVDPASKTGSNCEVWAVHERPRGYEAAKHGICAALRSGRIKGVHVPLFERDINGRECGEIEGTTDIDRSSVDRDSLVEWLSSRGIRTGFFFPATTGTPDYMDPKHPRYAPKLAAAVSAWQATTDPAGRSPRQALEKWLREHAAQFGLTDDEGNPINQAMEECAKVANWELGGGAPKTPSRANPPTPKP
ncbi:MAG: hypothetical protein NZ694_02230 [Tepidimonas sp.]|uniref:Uncharacterized protein n=1 Tax=Tepidimonas ignava TaxID=114249 RepID=A0A4R3LAG9_9BURK|nr:hypothetical protein [Tepidimonas ignava]MCS6810071.1 hypothetical protein [Tepidimonas sp.]MCX7692687.1 hypothetical protein [Tepidimonas taiwanensis]TCS95254.1 hypothetical protein EDC36_1151 [Tepidimonas ignava]TSE18156.1 hypothetical protein Tigna_02622 [Tepidimonas ignava]